MSLKFNGSNYLNQTIRTWHRYILMWLDDTVSATVVTAVITIATIIIVFIIIVDPADELYRQHDV